MRICGHFIRRIIDTSDIVSILGKYLHLKSDSRRYWAHCPFHEDKKPSFVISPEKKTYYCFGCGASGNALSFLKLYLDISFTDAVRHLAKILNIEIDYIANNSDNKIDIFNVLNQISSIFHEALYKNDLALSYLLKKRAILTDTIKQYQLGYSVYVPEKIGINSNILEAVGIVRKTRTNQYFDVFCNRIIFPIRNVNGDTVGLGGRVIEDNILPKYINSPETKLFSKRNNLYGIFEALSSASFVKNKTEVIIVEGYMDVLTLSQNGYSVVACLGTNITSTQIRILLNYFTKLYFCFDNDDAGDKATMRALKMCIPILSDIDKAFFCTLHPHKDPDSYLRVLGSEKFNFLLAKADNIANLFLKKISSPNLLEVLNKAQDILHNIKTSTIKVYLLKLMSEKYDIPIHTLISSLETHTITKQMPLLNLRANVIPTLDEVICSYALQYPINFYTAWSQYTSKLSNIYNLLDVVTPMFKIILPILMEHYSCSTAYLLELLKKIVATEQYSALCFLANKDLYLPIEAIDSELEGLIIKILTILKNRTKLSLEQQIKLTEYAAKKNCNK
jgi:DNA primase